MPVSFGRCLSVNNPTGGFEHHTLTFSIGTPLAVRVINLNLLIKVRAPPSKYQDIARLHPRFFVCI